MSCPEWGTTYGYILCNTSVRLGYGRATLVASSIKGQSKADWRIGGPIVVAEKNAGNLVAPT